MARAWSSMVDMALSDEEKVEQMMPIPLSERPDYPCGLRISLTEKELAKLDLDPNCEVGDVIDLRAFAEVTSVSKSDGPMGPCCRIELEIQRLAIETTEEPDDE